MNKAIEYAMFGGGPESFAGPVHRTAAQMDGNFILKAGMFSSNPQRSQEIARSLGIDESRAYTSVEECIEKERGRPDPVQLMSIVTPNQYHFSMAKASIEAGFHVMCEKPLTRTLEEAEELKAIVQKSGLVFAVSHAYSAYPMIHQAKKMVEDGVLGKIRMVLSECPQGTLSDPAEESSKPARWRTDPVQSGGGTVADIGTHAYHLITFVTGLQTSELCADLTSFVPGRKTNDNAQVMLRFASGARGMIWVSQIASGYENPFTLRVVGEHGSLEWCQEDADKLIFFRKDRSTTIITRDGIDYNAGDDLIRTKRGHGEGFLEAFANLYHFTAKRIQEPEEKKWADRLPSIEDGLSGMHFINNCLLSSNDGGIWVSA